MKTRYYLIVLDFVGVLYYRKEVGEYLKLWDSREKVWIRSYFDSIEEASEELGFPAKECDSPDLKSYENTPTNE